MGLLSYLRPRPEDAETTKPGIISEKPSDVATPNAQYPSTPGSYTPGNGTPWGSRPASLYPVGEFRNSQAEDLNEIKCDVMVNWLYQQQMERLWTAGGHDEGVVLKKSRSAYTCCPADIVEEPYGFHKAIETLNVRVCTALRKHCRSLLITL
nr:hypothetical protein CFP56_21112 [Quercus suber]